MSTVLQHAIPQIETLHKARKKTEKNIPNADEDVHFALVSMRLSCLMSLHLTFECVW